MYEYKEKTGADCLYNAAKSTGLTIIRNNWIESTTAATIKQYVTE